MTNRLTLTLAAAGAIATARPATADEDADRRAVLLELVQADSAAEALEADITFQTRAEVGECRDAMKRAAALGVPPTQEVTEGYLFKHAGARCDRYERWVRLKQGWVIATKHQHSLSALQSIRVGSAGGGSNEHIIAEAKQCMADLDALAAQGMAMDVPLKFPDANVTVTLAEARTRWCQGMIDWSTSFHAANAKVLADQAAAVRKKWVDLGAKGQKLDFLIEWGHWDMWGGRGSNCKILSDKERVKASVIYTAREDDAVFVVEKAVFKKNRWVSNKEKTFSKLHYDDWQCW